MDLHIHMPHHFQYDAHRFLHLLQVALSLHQSHLYKSQVRFLQVQNPLEHNEADSAVNHLAQSRHLKASFEQHSLYFPLLHCCMHGNQRFHSSLYHLIQTNQVSGLSFLKFHPQGSHQVLLRSNHRVGTE